MSHLRRIETYLRATQTPPTRFGREVAHDPRLVFDLRQGRSVGASLAARIDAYLDQVSL
jgi:hypothetical protein